MKFAKLIAESESLCVIKGKLTKQKIKERFLDANLDKLYDHLAECIINAKLSKPHTYRFKIQVHAQEKDDENS